MLYGTYVYFSNNLRIYQQFFFKSFATIVGNHPDYCSLKKMYNALYFIAGTYNIENMLLNYII